MPKCEAMALQSMHFQRIFNKMISLLSISLKNYIFNITNYTKFKGYTIKCISCKRKIYLCWQTIFFFPFKTILSLRKCAILYLGYHNLTWKILCILVQLDRKSSVSPSALVHSRTKKVSFLLLSGLTFYKCSLLDEF